MRILLAIAITAMVSGCSGSSPDASPGTSPPPEAVQAKPSDKELILDAVLFDILNNPDHTDTRGFYGTPGAMQIALVTNRDYGVPWPTTHQPLLSGWTVSRVEEGSERGWKQPRLLGVRIDKYFQEDEERASLFESPVAVTVMNAGGDENGAVIGGCSIYYNPKQVDGKWLVEFVGSMDP